MQPETYFVEQCTSARIPTEAGGFQLCYYRNNLDEKEHLALVLGEVNGRSNVLVRIHSECFTGDVLGSLRCDCGPQLQRAMHMIAEEGQGIILYLRQEGRGIGLLDKLRAYNLQDDGYDTVDANLMLGHQADARDYRVAALMLQDLGVQSVNLLTNNPNKIESIEALGIDVQARVAVPLDMNPENEAYLQTKVARMRHLLDISVRQTSEVSKTSEVLLDSLLPQIEPRNGRPYITITYAQSLDGSIALQRGQPTLISGPESLKLTHQLRAQHDAILVGIGTVLADDPSLTLRLISGEQPQPVIIDSHLKCPLNAKVFTHPKRPLFITTAQAAPEKQQQFANRGATVLIVPSTPAGLVDLQAAMTTLAAVGIQSVMVEGGAQIITSFLTAALVDSMVVTIAPRLLGGLNAVSHLNGHGLPNLHNPKIVQLGEDMVMSGSVVWQSAGTI